MQKRLQSNAHRCATALILAVALCGCATPSINNPAHASLLAPSDNSARIYLGIPLDAARFRVEDVQGEVVVVFFFDMYCHVCQSHAPRMAEFYDLVLDRGLAKTVKIIGVGVGDTEFEAQLFKQNFKLPFPVFADRKAEFAQGLGKIRVPNVLVARVEGKTARILYQGAQLSDRPKELLSVVQSRTPEPSSLPNESVEASKTRGECLPGQSGCLPKPFRYRK